MSCGRNMISNEIHIFNILIKGALITWPHVVEDLFFKALLLFLLSCCLWFRSYRHTNKECEQSLAGHA